MKKIFSGLLTIAISLALGLGAQAQEKPADVSAAGNTATQNPETDSQPSLSDEVLVPEQVASPTPVAPVPVPAGMAGNSSTGCGCGAAAAPTTGCATSPCASQCCRCRSRRALGIRKCGSQSTGCCATPCNSGCSACGSSAGPAVFSSPTTSCGCGSELSQVSLEQRELESVGAPCANVASASSAHCDPCSSSRSRGFLGRIFRNR